MNKKYYIAFLLVVFLFPKNSFGGSACNTLARFVCKDERFKKIKKIKDPRPFESLIPYIMDQAGYSDDADELTDALKGIDTDCGVAEKLAFVSQRGKTPYIRGLAEQSCFAFNFKLNSLLQFIPDR